MTVPPVAAPADLQPGDTLRYQMVERGNWRYLTYHGMNSDGSLDCYDQNGSARALRPDRYRFELKRASPRGKPMWVPLTTGGGT